MGTSSNARRAATARLDPESELQVELPPGIELAEPHLDPEIGDALRRVGDEGF